MNLADYLRRIGFEGDAKPTHQTLRDIPRCQVLSTTFENLDVQLRRPVSLDATAAYEKIVGDGRGGWCYELNGLLGWALREIGFDVMRIAATVERTGPRYGERWGDHLCLVVTFEEERFLVDAGFGGSLIEPMPLRSHRRHEAPYMVELEATGINEWRFKESAHGSSSYFDFLVEPADEEHMADTASYLQNDPHSPFVRNLVAMRRHSDRHEILRGRVRSTVTADTKEKTALLTGDELVASLGTDFGLDVPEIVDVWPSL